VRILAGISLVQGAAAGMGAALAWARTPVGSKNTGLQTSTRANGRRRRIQPLADARPTIGEQRQCDRERPKLDSSSST
jgi:hypothetical protein